MSEVNKDSIDSNENRSKTEDVRDYSQINKTPNPNLSDFSTHSKSKLYIVLSIILVLIVLVIALVAITKTKNSPTPTLQKTLSLAPANISITTNGFVPGTITIKEGQGVVWTNKDKASHQVDSDPYPTNNNFSSFNEQGSLQSGDSYSYIFNKPGVYTYHDNLNPYKLKGTIIVKS